MKEESYTQNIIMCDGSVKTTKKKRICFVASNETTTKHLKFVKCFVQLKKSSRSEFHKRFNEVFFLFVFVFVFFFLSIGEKVRQKYIKT